MPVYNGEAFLREAIDSILTQSHTDFELIVVNDGSTDRSSDIARSYGDPRLRLVDHRHSFLESLNTGLALARGKYLARQDADDIAMPHRLAQQVAFLEANPEVGVLGSAYVQVDQDGHHQRTKVLEQSDLKIKWLLLFGNQFRYTTVMWRRNVTEQVGGYQEMYCDDYDLLSRMARATKMANLPEPLAKFRVWRGSLSTVQRSQFIEASSAISTRNITGLLGAPVSPEAVGVLRMIHSSDGTLVRRDLLGLPGPKLFEASAYTGKLADRFVAAQRLGPPASKAFKDWVSNRTSRRLLVLANNLTDRHTEFGDSRWNTLETAGRLYAEAVRTRPAVLRERSTWLLAAKALLGPSLPGAFRRKQPTF